MRAMRQEGTLLLLLEKWTYGVCLPSLHRPPKKPRVQRARKEEKLPELKEIEDDEEDEGVAWVHFGLGKDF